MRERLRTLGRLPLRLRLTLWFVLLLGLTLTAFSAYVYARLERSVLEQTDAALRGAAAQVVPYVDEAAGRPALRDAADARETARRLDQAGLAVRLVAPDGAAAEVSGPFPAGGATLPDAPGYATVPQGDTDWRIYSRPLESPAGLPLGWVQVAQSLTAAQETLESLYGLMLLGLPLVLALAGLGGFLVADRALRPID